MASHSPLIDKNGKSLAIILPFTTDPQTNLALEDIILEKVGKRFLPNALRFWVNRECLVAGQHRSPKYGWYDEQLATDIGVPVYRRSTGGGVVYHDLGNLNWSFYLASDGAFLAPSTVFEWPSSVIVKGLRRLGLNAYFSPPNRIDVERMKVSGLAARSTLTALLVHGTLLVRSNLEKLNALCQTPRECPPACNLSMWKDITEENIIRSLIDTLRETRFNLSFYGVPTIEHSPSESPLPFAMFKWSDNPLGLSGLRLFQPAFHASEPLEKIVSMYNSADGQ